MMDDEDWQRHCWEFDKLVAAHRGRPLPPGLLAFHQELRMARMRVQQAWIMEMIEMHGGQNWKL